MNVKSQISSLSAQPTRHLNKILQQSRLASVVKPLNEDTKFTRLSKIKSLLKKKSQSQTLNVKHSLINASRVQRKYSAEQRFHPTHQVITSTPSSRYRYNWGLKSNLPSTKNSFIICNSLDKNGMSDFYPGASFALISRRVTELRTPITPLVSRITKSDRNDIFSSILPSKDSQKSVPNHSTSSTIEQRKVSFLNYLKSLGYTDAGIYKITKDQLLLETLLSKVTASKSEYSQSFSQIPFSIPTSESRLGSSDNTISILKRPIATAGLSYLLRGSLNNRPSSMLVPRKIKYSHSPVFESVEELNYRLPSASVDYPIIPGRFVEKTGTMASVTGIAATSNLVGLEMKQLKTQKIIHSSMQPFSIRSIGLKNNGAIEMNVEARNFPHPFNSNQTNNRGKTTSNISLTNKIKMSLSSNSSLNRSRSKIQRGDSEEDEFF